MFSLSYLSPEKVFFHPERLVDMLERGDTYPVHLSLGLTDYCNHNCLWCWTAYSTHDNIIVKEDGSRVHVGKGRDERLMDADVLLRFLEQAQAKGLRSATIAGSGEPLLHPRSEEILHRMGELGLDFALQSNGSIVSDDHLEAIVKYGTYFRFSVDAADQETYAKLRRGSAHLETTLGNLERMVRARNASGRKMPTIGAQYVVNELNLDGVVAFARMIRELGADYVAFKPLIENPINPDRVIRKADYEEVAKVYDEVEKLATDDFTVFAKREQYQTVMESTFNDCLHYGRCMGHPFSANLYSNGEMYTCINLAGRKEALFGNIYENTFEEIWQSSQRRSAIECIDLKKKCPAGCRMDPLNRILWQVLRPSPELHPNFL